VVNLYHKLNSHTTTMTQAELEKIKIYASAEEVGKKFDISAASRRVEALAKTPYGKTLMAAQMREQIMREMLYEGRARLMLDVYYLAQGEEAVFDADLDVPAAALSQRGLPNMLEVISDRIRIDTNPLSSTFIVKWNEQNFRKFDVMELARRRGQASVQLQEDFKFYNLLMYAKGLSNQSPVISLAGTSAATNNPSTIPATVVGKIFPQDIATAIGTLRSKLLPVGSIFINPLRVTDFLLFNTVGSTATGGFGIFAPSIQEETLRTGLVGEIFGIPLYDSVVVNPTNDTFVLAPKEYLGKLAIRSDIDVRYLSDANKSGDVFNIWEDIGMLIRYAKGIVYIDLTA